MAEPGEHGAAAAGGRGRLRASHADREQVIEVLKDAFAQGRLDKDELDSRAGRALASRTYAELAAVTAGIPAGPAAAPPPGQPARGRNRVPMSNTARGVAIGSGVGLGLVAAIVPGGLLQYAPYLLAAAAFVLLVVVPCVVLYKVATSLPPRPGQGGQAAEAPGVRRPGQAGQAGRDPALPQDRPGQARADLRTHRSRPGRPRSPARGARAPRGMLPLPGAV